MSEGKKILNVEDEDIELINGRVMYYTTSQVSTIIDEKDSTIRYWCSQFSDIVKPSTVGKHRRFSEADIEKLRFIKMLLREKNYSVQQVIEYVGVKSVEAFEEKVNEGDVLATRIIVNELVQSIGVQLQEFTDNLKGEIVSELKEQLVIQQAENEKLKELIESNLKLNTDMISQSMVNINNTITENIKQEVNTLKETLNTVAKNNDVQEQRDIDIVNNLKAMLEEQKRYNEEMTILRDMDKTSQENKSFFKRLFGK